MNNTTTADSTQIADVVLTLIVINSISGFLATVLNFLIILTFVKTPSLRTTSFILILSLAVTDFGVGAVVQPTYCIRLVTKNKHLFSLATAVHSCSYQILITASLLTVTAITADRFLAVFLHLRYQELVTITRASLVVFLLWIASVSLYFIRRANSVIIFRIEDTFMTLVLLLNIILMLKISCVAREHAVQILAQQQSIHLMVQPCIKTSINIMYYILGAFIICYYPSYILYIIKESTGKKLVVVSHFLQTLVMVNSAINPIIYFWRITEMRKAAVQMLTAARGENHHSNNNHII